MALAGPACTALLIIDITNGAARPYVLAFAVIPPALLVLRIGMLRGMLYERALWLSLFLNAAMLLLFIIGM